MTISSARHPDEQPARTPAPRRASTWSSPDTTYRQLFDTTQEAILTLDTGTGRILDVNPFLEKLMGCSRADLLGTELWHIGVFADIDTNHAALCALREHGYVRYEHLSLETTTGRAVDVELVGTTYVTGGVTVAQCTIRDITERTLVEKQLLKQADEQADLLRSKDELFAILSHEFRDSLFAIADAVILLRQESCGLPLHETSGAIVVGQVEQLALIVDALLDLARITTGPVRLRRERVDQHCIVEHAMETV